MGSAVFARHQVARLWCQEDDVGEVARVGSRWLIAMKLIRPASQVRGWAIKFRIYTVKGAYFALPWLATASISFLISSGSPTK